MDPFCRSLLDKITEQFDSTSRLLPQLSPDALDWRPTVPHGNRPLWRGRDLLAHFNDCMAGFLAVLLRLRPRELAHLEQYRSLPAPEGVEPALERFAAYRSEIEAGFALLTPADLVASVPTVFVTAGEPALTLLLGNLEHFINHKHQLFLYLRMLGLPVSTADLYCLRGKSPDYLDENV